MEEIQFETGDKLPTVYDVATSIFSYATQPESEKMKKVIVTYAKHLIEIWEKAFGGDHVLSRNAVKYKLKKIVKEYFNQVYNKAHRKAGRGREREEQNESNRRLSRKWKENNNNLFNIGKDMDTLKGIEKQFYTDQKTERSGHLSNEVDEEYEEERKLIFELNEEKRKRDETEERHAMFTDDFIIDEQGECSNMNSTMNSLSTSNVSCNRSGHVRVKPVGVSIGTQTDSCVPNRPKLRIKEKISTDEVKSTCAMLSATCGVSPEMSRRIVQIVCRELYNHDFYLSPAEQLAGEEGDSDIEQNNAKDRCKNRMYVLPSARVIADHKQFLACETECEAAKALYGKDQGVKAIVHFDTTSRSNIDGEWPSIILRFSNGKEFRLRPLFFAYEDRQQITDLFSETFKRLSSALSVRNNETIEPSVLWEKVDCLMTDAVVKNLEIENSIPAALNSDHHPYHLLCKSHTVEALDRSNLEVLRDIEAKVNQRELFESINPALKSFFRGKTALAEAGIEALLNLVTHNKSAKSCSQADVFDHICEREGVSKRIFLYQQRRFAKLGKAAAALLHAKDILQMVLHEVELTNQLVESCNIYLSSELFITELECLAFFNHYVTFPYLNCVEVSNQEELLKIIPKLYNDLLEKKTDTLHEFVVSIHGIPIPKITSDVAKEIVDVMCVSAAEAIKRQCGREYGFSDGEKLRATDISSLTPEQRADLPVNNCISERDLSKFDKEAAVSRCRNRWFKAKNIRNNMVLYKSKSSTKVDRISKRISLILADRETKWNATQNVKHKERLELKLKKAVKAKDYTRKLLQDCKSWGGPVTAAEELRNTLRGKDNQQKILKTEMSYYAHTHKVDKFARKELFRINGISYDEMLENLLILLDDEKHESRSTVANLPSNDDVMKSLAVTTTIVAPESSPSSSHKVNEMCVVAWQIDDGKYEWYLGYIKKIEDDMFLVDHLERSLKSSDAKWKYPSREDMHLVDAEQLIEVTVEGEWDNSPDSRKRLFSLSNSKTISSAFRKHVD